MKVLCITSSQFMGDNVEAGKVYDVIRIEGSNILSSEVKFYIIDGMGEKRFLSERFVKLEDSKYEDIEKKNISELFEEKLKQNI